MVQRVDGASVVVDGAIVGEIVGEGLCVLVGVTHDDTPEKAAVLARKLWSVRILEGEKSCSDNGAPLLVISQFTLYGDARKGRRPTWNAAAPGPVAEPLVDCGLVGGCAVPDLDDALVADHDDLDLAVLVDAPVARLGLQRAHLVALGVEDPGVGGVLQEVPAVVAEDDLLAEVALLLTGEVEDARTLPVAEEEGEGDEARVQVGRDLDHEWLLRRSVGGVPGRSAGRTLSADPGTAS
ncbi:D-aminoacyl-tRNA deacylase [Streptomyces avidinii]